MNIKRAHSLSGSQGLPNRDLPLPTWRRKTALLLARQDITLSHSMSQVKTGISGVHLGVTRLGCLQGKNRGFYLNCKITNCQYIICPPQPRDLWIIHKPTLVSADNIHHCFLPLQRAFSWERITKSSVQSLSPCVYHDECWLAKPHAIISYSSVERQAFWSGDRNTKWKLTNTTSFMASER